MKNEGLIKRIMQLENKVDRLENTITMQGNVILHILTQISDPTDPAQNKLLESFKDTLQLPMISPEVIDESVVVQVYLEPTEEWDDLLRVDHIFSDEPEFYVMKNGEWEMVEIIDSLVDLVREEAKNMEKYPDEDTIFAKFFVKEPKAES